MKTLKLNLFSLFFLFIFQGCGSTSSDPNNSVNARAVMWQFVEQELKNPSSADFGMCEMTKTSSGAWETDCYVDATNGFGATIRNEFYCRVKRKSDGNWQLEELSFY